MERAVLRRTYSEPRTREPQNPVSYPTHSTFPYLSAPCLAARTLLGTWEVCSGLGVQGLLRRSLHISSKAFGLSPFHFLSAKWLRPPAPEGLRGAWRDCAVVESARLITGGAVIVITCLCYTVQHFVADPGQLHSPLWSFAVGELLHTAGVITENDRLGSVRKPDLRKP